MAVQACLERCAAYFTVSLEYQGPASSGAQHARADTSKEPVTWAQVMPARLAG